VARKKRGRGVRYSAADKKRIMAAARKGNLTGAQVQKRFGVSPLTYYRWRGPVRRRRVGANRGRASGGDDIRVAVRAHVQRVLPQVIREQVREYLAEILGQRKRGRPRTRV
jgi:transposase-like protein